MSFLLHNDILTVTFPFGSEIFLEFLFNGLCPMINKWALPPMELMPPNFVCVYHTTANMHLRSDGRILKGAGVILKQRNWLRGGKKEGRSVLAFKMCEIEDRFDVDVEDALGGKKNAKGWKLEHRLVGVPVGYWDAMWLRLMDALELKGKDVGIDDLWD